MFLVYNLFVRLFLAFFYRYLCTENSLYLDEISKKYPSPARVWMGPDLYILVTDAECAEQVLKEKKLLNKPKVYEAVADALDGHGLFTSSGNTYCIMMSYNFVCAY